jgi:ferrous iron transport protein A
MNRLTLLDPAANKRARVVAVQGGWGVSRRLAQLGIHPGDIITVLRHGAFGGPVLIEIHGYQVALGRGVAARILLEEVQ